MTGLDLSNFPALASRNLIERSANPTPLLNPLAGRAPNGKGEKVKGSLTESSEYPQQRFHLWPLSLLTMTSFQSQSKHMSSPNTSPSTMRTFLHFLDPIIRITQVISMIPNWYAVVTVRLSYTNTHTIMELGPVAQKTSS